MKLDGELKTMTVYSSGVNFLDGTVRLDYYCLQWLKHDVSDKVVKQNGHETSYLLWLKHHR